jgi:hypothetical protein
MPSSTPPGGGGGAAAPPAPVAPVAPGGAAPVPPAWYQAAVPGQSTGVSPQDYLQQVIYNQMLPYMDPITQRETALWLARDNPQAYGAYGGLDPTGGAMPPLAPPIPGAAALGGLTSSLDFNTLLGTLPSASKKQQNLLSQIRGNTPQSAPLRAGVGWLQEALRTAMGGLPGSTRAQQQLAGGHLTTLMKEAEREPNRGGLYTTLFQNLMNPITQRAPTSGLFGAGRALSNPAGGFRRKGVAFRNVGLT